MRLRFTRSVSLITLLAAAALSTAQNAGAQTFQGPSSSQTPYVVPSAPGWAVASLITTGDFDKAGAYRMVGIPDGLGALAGRFRHGRYVADKAYMTVFMNHEIPAGQGVARAHGQNGAFVSQWTIHLNSLEVRRGQDLIQRIFAWDAATGTFVPATPAQSQLSRLCSADLPAFEAFYNPETKKGFNGRLFMDGEEAGDEGRAFAHVLTGDGRGDSYQLPHLGRFSWENSSAHPDAGDKTIVIGTDDSTPGQVYVYIGEKRKTGNPVERAGLVGGSLFGIKVTNGGALYGGGAVARETNGAINGTFVLQGLGNVSNLTGAQLQANSVAAGITQFARPEDNAWDTKNPRVFYFVTTGANLGTSAVPNNQSSRLYKLTLNSLSNPTGGTIELIVDRAVGLGPSPVPVPPSTSIVAVFDNITVDGDGNVLVEEDPGNNPYVAKIWKVNPTTKTAEEILHSDPVRFGLPTPPYNQDEESSGIIEVTNLVRSARWYEHGTRYYLADLQDHHIIAGEEVEGGQLYLVASPRSHRHDDDGDDDDHGHGHDDDDDHGHH